MTQRARQPILTPLLQPLSRVIPLILIVAILYFAREVCIPLALALLLSFVLHPFVDFLERYHLPRVPAVVLSLLLALSLFVATTWMISNQILQFADELPQYQSNVHRKLTAFHPRPGSLLDRLRETYDQYSREFESLVNSSSTQPAPPQPDSLTSAVAAGAAAVANSASTNPSDTKPAIMVTIAKPKATALGLLQSLLFHAIGPLVSTGIVLVLSLFILIQWDDVRDRAIRLLGGGRLTLTTKAMDDASRRVSRYLAMQVVINTLFGLSVSAGLYFIGVPYPLLWGVLSSLLRFIPYFGVPVASLFPFLMAFAAMPTLTPLALTIALYVGLEIVIANFIEPWLYGASTGISPLAILVAAIFWTWIWGPIGLLLSTPLTVCLAVLGRHVPKLQYLDTLFGDRPVLSPELRFYQRLLAGDDAEALAIATQRMRETSITETFDSLLIPVLIHAEQDFRHHDIDHEKVLYIHQHMRTLIDAVPPDLTPPASLSVSRPSSQTSPQSEPKKDNALPLILCIPASTLADELVARMLARLLAPLRVNVHVLPSGMLSGERITQVEEHLPTLVCVSSVPPGAAKSARYLCSRLRAQYPQLKILVGLWNLKSDRNRLRARIAAEPADLLAISLAEAVEQISSAARLHAAQKPSAQSPISHTLPDSLPNAPALPIP